LVEHGPYRIREPVVQFVAATAPFAEEFDTEAKLGQRYRADVELLKWTDGNKRKNSRFWF
jgi:hypothetical protein